jgi:palmitoyl-protein thioesterase
LRTVLGSTFPALAQWSSSPPPPPPQQQQLLLLRQGRQQPAPGKKQLPVVFAHGMGDSCFNDGMRRIAQHASRLLGGAYAVCIPTADTQAEDTRNGYFMNWDDSVDAFAERVAQDPRLAGGFHAVGFSQGSNVVRGYVARYNDPPVRALVSVNGVNAGIGAVPYCRPEAAAAAATTASTEAGKAGSASTAGEREAVASDRARRQIAFSMCELLMEQASRSAYTEFAQKHSFQANYWRDPRPSEADLYHRYSQLAVWNNEAGGAPNETLRENWARTEKFVWIMATEDGMVWPREGEQWGAPDSDSDDPFSHILPMNLTKWYQDDLFGLRTAQEANKNFFESFEGDHLAFTEADFNHWVNTYLRD